MPHSPTRFRDLQAPALIDLGARTTPSGGDRAALALANALGQFSDTTADIASQLRTAKGKREGAEAGLTKTPEFRRGFRGMTAFGRAYNDAALRSYAIKSEIDLQENAARLEAEAGTDPEAFGKAMTQMRDSVLEEAPPEAHAIVTQIYNKRTAVGLARIQTALVNELREEDRTLVSEQVSQLTERVAFLRSQDTPEAHVEAEQEEAKLFLLLDAAEEDGTISESEARLARTEARRGIVFETVISRFKNEINNPFGDPIGFIEDLKEANRTAKTLTPDDEAKLESALFAELREHNTLRSARDAQELAEVEARLNAGDRDITAGILRREITDDETIADAVENQFLRPGRATTLSNMMKTGSAAESDPETRFMVMADTLQFTREEIENMADLTWDDKLAAIEKLEKDTLGWASDPRAREAYARLNRALKIEPGISSVLLSKAEMKILGTARTMLYDAVEELPPEEQREKVLEIAEKIIKDVVKVQLQDELEMWRTIQRDGEIALANPDLDEFTKNATEEDVRDAKNKIRELETRAQ